MYMPNTFTQVEITLEWWEQKGLASMDRAILLIVTILTKKQI